MASRGKHKGSAHRKPAQGAKSAAGTQSGGAASSAKTAANSTTSARQAGTATASRPATAKATNSAGNRSSSVLARRASTTAQPGYRSRMNQRRNTRRQQLRILGTVAAVAVVGVFAWVLISNLTARAGAANSKAAKPGATAQVSAAATHTGVAATATKVVCEAVSVPGLNGTPTTSGGPPAVSGTLVTADQCLQYVDIKPGSGAAVKAGDNVVVNYTGWLTNGKKFDSSLDSGRTPFTVQNVGQAQVIQGWNMGLIGMKVGGERRLVIPYQLAYGAGGYPPSIPAYATLIFDISVVSIN